MRRGARALALALLAAHCAAQEVFYGKVQVVAVHGRDQAPRHARELRQQGRAPGGGLAHEHQLNLKLKSGELRRLLLPAGLEHDLPRSGSYLAVTSQPPDACGGAAARDGAICVRSMMAHEAALRDLYSEGQPRGALHVKMLVMQLDVCGRGPATEDWDDLEAAIWSTGKYAGKYGGRTVVGMFKGCSFGMADVSKHLGSDILKVTIPIPCAGTTPDGFAYNSSTCPYNEWSDVANEWVRKNTNVTLEDFPFKAYLVPGGAVCGWGGMGYVGCFDDCRVWINGDLWDEPTTYFHEISHNFFLNHAGKWGNLGYDDMSGAMGFCCEVRCHNAPHSYQLGWAGPLKTLHAANWGPGVWNAYELPAAARDPRNFIRVWPDWSKRGAKTKLYIQFKQRTGYDRELPTNGSFADRVTVYSASANDPQPFTSWEAGIAEGEQWREARLGSNVVVRVPKFGNGSAEVSLCHWDEERETSCSDGLDNDCDGRTDDADPDCGGPPSGEDLPEAHGPTAAGDGGGSGHSHSHISGGRGHGSIGGHSSRSGGGKSSTAPAPPPTPPPAPAAPDPEPQQQDFFGMLFG